MGLIVIALLYGLIWVWRGSKYSFHGYWNSLVSAFVIIGLWFLYMGGTIFSLNGLQVLVALALAEGILGYGETCEAIDANGGGVKDNKEHYMYLGLISYFYYCFPYSMLVSKPVNPIILMASFLIYPVLKYIQYRADRLLKNIIYIDIPFYPRLVQISKINIDTWKVIVEFPLGILFLLWYI